MKETAACPSCGAKLKADTDRCDLCGTLISEIPEAEHADEMESEIFTEEPIVASPAGADQSAEIGPVPCGTCKHVNPARSQFCNQCGTFLTGAPSASTQPKAAAVPQEVDADVEEVVVRADVAPARPPSDVGRRALGMVGLAVAAVVVLYGLTMLSNRNQAPDTSEGGRASVAGPPESGDLPDSLRAMATALEAEGTASGWARLGNLYFTTAMQSANENARAELASRAVDAFDLSLGIEDNTDVRTSLAEAAQFDARNPMRAVLELQAVLAAEPDHIAANYLLGALRARIGRLDGASESFQRVIDLTPEDDPIHQRAAADLAAVRQTMTSAPAGQ